MTDEAEAAKLRELNRERIAYINQVLVPLLDADPELCFSTVLRMILKEGQDVFGSGSRAMQFLEQVAVTGDFDDINTDFSKLVPDEVALIKR